MRDGLEASIRAEAIAHKMRSYNDGKIRFSGKNFKSMPEPTLGLKASS